MAPSTSSLKYSIADSCRTTLIDYVSARQPRHVVARRVPMSSGEFWPELYNNLLVLCPLCGVRRARRGCPALDKQICAVCCGTKRLVQIHCPSDCTWLASAREHPPAVVVRRHQRDLGVL